MKTSRLHVSDLDLSTAEKNEISRKVGEVFSLVVRDPELGSGINARALQNFELGRPISRDELVEILDVTEILIESEGSESVGGSAWVKLSRALSRLEA